MVRWASLPTSESAACCQQGPQPRVSGGRVGAEPDPALLPQLLPHIPRMVASLVKEDSNSGTSCLEQLSELVHCMVFRFPGFPDLYEPVMEAIKVSDSPLLGPRPTLTKVPVWAFLWAIPQLGGSPRHLPRSLMCLKHTEPLTFPKCPGCLMAALSFCTHGAL